MKVLINFEIHKFNLKNISTVPLYERVKNIILLDIQQNYATKLKLNTFVNGIGINTVSQIQEKNFLFIEKIDFLYSRTGRKITLELNLSPSEIDDINKMSPFSICSVEEEEKLGKHIELIEFYRGIYSQNCDIIRLIQNLIERAVSAPWQRLIIIKEYILLGTGEIIKRIQKGKEVDFPIEDMPFFDEGMYIGDIVLIVNEYLEAFYSYLRKAKDDPKFKEASSKSKEDDPKFKELKEKHNLLKEEIKNDYSKAFTAEMGTTISIAINSFIREGMYLGLALKNELNSYRTNANPSNTYRSQLSYISKFKRMVSSDFIKETILDISDENIKRKMGDLFSKYNECKFFFDSYKDSIISFTDIEDFAFYFQRLPVINLNLDEKVITLTTEELKGIFNNLPLGLINFNQPRYNLWFVPYIQFTGKPEIVLMLDRITGKPYKIMRTDDLEFYQECQNGIPHILESIIPVL